MLALSCSSGEKKKILCDKRSVEERVEAVILPYKVTEQIRYIIVCTRGIVISLIKYEDF